ncbi:unnamed protein product [Amaranthus hypochondriacus]
MEVPYEREEEEDLQPRRRSSLSPNPPNNNNTSSSSESSFTSDSSCHGSVIMDNDPTINGNSANIITNGENPTTIEQDLSHGREKEAYFEEPISVAQNEDSNGLTVKQNGVGVVEYSLPERNGGDEETDIESIAPGFFKSPEAAVGLQYVESLLDDNSNGVNGVLPKIYNGENIADSALIVSGQTEIVETNNSEEVEPEGEEFDVERVIKEQKTHDLYCPYCKECITDRVILKRRKRKRQDLPKDEPLVVKTGRLTAMRPDLVDRNLDNDQAKELERPSDEPLEAISCFSCFRIFFPKGDGFLCWRFKPEPDVTLHPDERLDEDSDPTKTKTRRGTIFPLWILTCCQPYHPEDPVSKPEQSPTNSDKEFPRKESDISSKTSPATDVPPGDGILHLTNSHGTPLPSKFQSPITPGSGTANPPAPLPPVSPVEETELPPEQKPPAALKKVPAREENVQQPPDKKGDVIIPMPDVPEPHPLHPIVSTSETPLLRQPSEPPRPGAGVDIMKAIVYGGLLECITSLSVISSAAGGDATTLNIVALGLANVFGGFIVLIHNLMELKQEQGTERYLEQLGRAGHFVLHAFVAILSYLVFGLMSPFIYGFTFRKSDNKDYKLATLAGASLVCITILSIGKAYVQKSPKPYFSTVFYYISMGFMVSGITYVAGDLINMLLKKLGVFDHRAPPVLGAGAVNGAWSSY